MNVIVNSKCKDCDKREVCKYLEDINRFVYSAERTRMPSDSTVTINCTYYRLANNLIPDPLVDKLRESNDNLKLNYGGTH